MQSHLKYHGLPPEEVDRLAGNIYAVTTQLRMAKRTTYHRRTDNSLVGASPQTYVDGTPVPDYSKYDCLGGFREFFVLLLFCFDPPEGPLNSQFFTKFR